jgi:hypothetical protein
MGDRSYDLGGVAMYHPKFFLEIEEAKKEGVISYTIVIFFVCMKRNSSEHTIA